ncbi:MAG: ABC transporter ATP-binding protein [bacterium]
MLAMQGLTKTYPGGVMALRGVSLSIGPGMFGLLGPNGAGKSTLMKILATLLDPDSGSVEFDGVDLLREKEKVREIVGYLPQEFGFYPAFSARKMLEYFASLRGMHSGAGRRARVDELLERVNLREAADRKVGGFSGGMRQRLGIAQALIAKPRLLIVDEPTAGLDPEERLRFHNLLAEISQEIVVLLSTHIVSDVAVLCSRMAVIIRGQIVADMTPGEAVARLEGHVFEGTLERERVNDLAARCKILSRMVASPTTMRVKVFCENGAPADGFRPAGGNLEDAYFRLVGDAGGTA